MKRWHKILLGSVLAPVLVVGAYVGYLAATYLDETVTAGAAHGFEIGASKQQALGQAAKLLDRHHAAVIYISFGPRAGDNFTVAPSAHQLDRLRLHGLWSVQLDGPNSFFNTVKLTFNEDSLVEIHRHRKHFELP